MRSSDFIGIEQVVARFAKHSTEWATIYGVKSDNAQLIALHE
jgi:hypothetical protein